MTVSRADYVALDGVGLAELIRRREMSVEEVHACAVDLAAELNPKLNAFIEIFDKPLSYKPDGPFAGVPFAIKDLLCHAEGVLNENGSRLSAGLKSGHDTELMSRFRSAGCGAIGRVATPELGYCASTEPVLTGAVHNPWDLTRMPGGSSGGSGAVVAAGIVPFAHANDGGGSIRIPAACNGLVGLKPTRGRVSLGPDLGEAVNGLAVEFALTRTVRDCAALLDAVQGAAPGDPYAIAPPSHPYAELLTDVSKPLRIAVMTAAWSGVPVDPAMVEGTERAARLCESLGHQVEVAAPLLDNDAFITATHCIWVTALHHFVDTIAAASGRIPGPDNLEATTLACYRDGSRTSAAQLQRALSIYNEVTRSFARFFGDYDVLLTPTVASPALPLGTLNADDSSLSAREWTEKVFAFAAFTPQFNMTGQPAISLPLHRTAAQLPVGVQFVARRGEEHTLLRLAAQLEVAAPWPLVAPIWREVH